MIDIKVLASGSSGNAYMVSDGTTNILLDAGLSWRRIQELSGFRRIDAVLCSHIHADHSKGVAEALRMGVTVYMPKVMTEKYDSAFAHGLYDQCSVGGANWMFRSFDLVHDVPALGYCIDIGGSRIVYITDSAYTKYTIPNVSHWILEINYVKEVIDANVENGTIHQALRNRIVQTHMSLDTAIQLLKANDLSKTQEIRIVHLSNDNSDAELIKNTVEAATGKLTIIA
jgi:phosphoribosyl 1,2-cyclic phosphodiesterase